MELIIFQNYSFLFCYKYDGMHDLYGYDTKKYGTTCNNGISENKLFQVLVDYAKLHFIYFCQSYGVKNEN